MRVAGRSDLQQYSSFLQGTDHRLLLSILAERRLPIFVPFTYTNTGLNLDDAVELIKPAFAQIKSPQLWADLGSGSGLFARALAALLLPGSTIQAVDKRKQRIEQTFNGNAIVFHDLDFTGGILPFGELDGILMANSLHFVKEKEGLLSTLRGHLHKNGQLLIIEYDMHKGNGWVPYPIPYLSLKELLTKVGFSNIHAVGERRSMYQAGKMYACAARNS